MKTPTFNAKILLFGEYGIINNSKGLTIPYKQFSGFLSKPILSLDSVQQESHKKVKDFLNFLMSIDSKILVFDRDKIKNDLDENIYFESSIPQGYGLGSSGALVAAVYSRYSKNRIIVLEKISKEKLKTLKLIFSKMESFFHGNSSGLDPLNSYTNKPILINSKNNIELSTITFQNLDGKGAVFLLDTMNRCETAPMVNLFFENMKKKSFSRMMKNQFSLITESCVKDFTSNNYKNLFFHLKELSVIVYKNFKSMIPDKYYDVWLEGINSDAYYLKLCGSGGGGYILGFTQNWKKAQKKLSAYDLLLVNHLNFKNQLN